MNHPKHEPTLFVDGIILRAHNELYGVITK